MRTVAVLISGRGSNLGALIAAQGDSYRIVLSAGVNLVVIDVVGAPDVDTAANVAESLARTQTGCLAKGAASPCKAPALSGLKQG